jgi:hypothetical protein
VGFLLHRIQHSGVLHFRHAAHAGAHGSNHLKENVMHELVGSAKLDERKPKDQKQAEEEEKAKTVSRPGGFSNDPDDPKNPNEVRERHQRKIRP